jgi:hypothetical protein
MSDAAPELPQGLAGFVQDGRLFHRADAAAQRVQLALYRLIAAGLPVSGAGLAQAVGRDPVEVAEILAAIPASNFLYDSGGQIVGFRGLGQVPSRHHLGFAGKRLFAWCAFDCLFLARLRLTVTPGGVAAAGPEATVMSFVTPEAARMRAELREVFCAKVHFFGGPEPAAAWRANHPEATILTLDQGVELARLRNAAGFGAVL